MFATDASVLKRRALSVLQRTEAFRKYEGQEKMPHIMSARWTSQVAKDSKQVQRFARKLPYLSTNWSVFPKTLFNQSKFMKRLLTAATARRKTCCGCLLDSFLQSLVLMRSINYEMLARWSEEGRSWLLFRTLTLSLKRFKFSINSSRPLLHNRLYADITWFVLWSIASNGKKNT